MSFKFWRHDATRDTYTGTFDTATAVPSGVYRLTSTSYDEPELVRLTPRQDEIFTFQSGPMTQVMREIEEFWDNQSLYKQLSITHKRGLLLFGPPGCGKSGILNAIINTTVQRNGIVLELTQRVNSYAEAIPWLRQIEKDRLIVTIIEDIDDLAEDWEEELLEVMDGHTSLGDGLLYVATTNNLEDVPDRIKNRPSRIDTLIEVPFPEFELRLEYLTRLLGKINKPLKTQLRNYATQTEGMSLADLKEVVISLTVYKRGFDETVKRLRRSDVSRSDDDQTSGKR